MQRTETRGGITIVEVLVGVLLVSVIVMVVLTPLTGFFGLTQRSTQQVGATQTAQQVLETIRGDWLSLAMYDQRCTTATIPSGTTLTVTNLDLNGAPTGTVTLNASCSGNTPDPAPVRRVQLVARSGTAQSTLSVDVARP
ncbi:hypothetical protein [Deinococcus multiflagellatus]|uniref:hypothetical protein n=1 Tax=Deinococcus multiflagellatus TaxID=1656887 RepID=UPI001CCB713C|nr:hypothetical protein [Deinococcus multiflagellatus]MBZ9713171.1 hypothetical protein [Deinococcus multiflagellatus]